MFGFSTSFQSFLHLLVESFAKQPNRFKVLLQIYLGLAEQENTR